jgi:hypothetical protein
MTTKLVVAIVLAAIIVLSGTWSGIITLAR